MSEAFILAYLQDGEVATMHVSDRDEFQPGVTTAEAWDAMTAAERAAFAAKGSPESIRQREQVRAAAASRRKTAGRKYGQQVQADAEKRRAWAALPLRMYEGVPDGIIEWQKTSEVGTWKPSDGNVTVTERWDADSNDWVYPEEPARFPKGMQPKFPLRETADEARADSRALQDADA